MNNKLNDILIKVNETLHYTYGGYKLFVCFSSYVIEHVTYS